MYDLDVSVETGKEQFQKLFKSADEYDDLLKNEFGCIDRLIE
jgi:serine protease Do